MLKIKGKQGSLSGVHLKFKFVNNKLFHRNIFDVFDMYFDLVDSLEIHGMQHHYGFRHGKRGNDRWCFGLGSGAAWRWI